MAIKGEATLEDTRVEWTDKAQNVELKPGELFVVVDEFEVDSMPAKHWSGVLDGRMFFMQLGIALSWDGEVPNADEAWEAADEFERVTGIRLAP
jgi:hypothetical protein